MRGRAGIGALPRVRVAWLAAGLGVVVALALVLLPSPYGVTPQTMRAAAVVVLAISLWATSAIPEDVTAILFFLLSMLLAVAPAEVVFSGFHSTALWLVFGGLVIGAAVSRSGLARRLTRGLVGWLGTSYTRIVFGVALVSVGLGFLMPSTMSRVVLLVPIVTALADQVGFAPGSRGRTGMVVTAVIGTYLGPAGVLPANVPNVVLAGVAETQFGLRLTYGSYLVLVFPVLSALKVALMAGLARLLFADAPRPSADADVSDDAPLGRGQRRLAILLALALGLWATDSLHHVSPGWIALGVALVCLLPGVGLIPPEEFAQRVNLRPVFYVAGILGLGAVVASSGLGDLISGRLIDLAGFSLGSPGWNYAALAAVGTFMGTFATMPGMAAILTPFANDIAGASGLPLDTVVLGAALGYSTVLLPYQVPPIVVGISLAGERLADGARLLLATAAFTVVVILPLNYLWWRALGAL